MNTYKKLILITATLCFFVVGLGAYVRLSDAGLGCPDWPGCYGHVGVPQTPDHIEKAQNLYPDFPVEAGKAWKEMIHRYFASTLGLLIVIITFMAYRLNSQKLLATMALAVVIFQGLLGMWTVTLLLKPAIVTAHLLGGIATLGLLVTLYLRLSPISEKLTIINAQFYLRALALITLIILIAQIALGGWTSSNYAALACQGFPACNGSFMPQADYTHAWAIWRELGMTDDGQYLPVTSLVAIHWLHRWGALILSIFAGLLILKLWSVHRLWGIIILIFLSIQILLGVFNVILSLPIAIAVAHNLGAAILIISMLMLNFSFKNPQLICQNTHNK